MRIFEPHIHMISRVTDDYVAMANAGVELVLEPAFWMGQPRTQAGTFVDYWDALLGYEVQRARQFGIEHISTLSVNPREANNAPLAAAALDLLPPYLERERVVGVGEIGFDDITDAETDVYRKQLLLAMKTGLPALVHTPHRKKAFGTKRSIEIARELRFPVEKLLLDHATEETIEMILESGAWAGFTVYPNTKLSPERAANMIMQFGVERMMVNSSADWGPSTVLSVPLTIVELRRRGLLPAKIQQLVWDNPFRFYDQTGRLSKILGG